MTYRDWLYEASRRRKKRRLILSSLLVVMAIASLTAGLLSEEPATSPTAIAQITLTPFEPYQVSPTIAATLSLLPHTSTPSPTETPTGPPSLMTSTATIAQVTGIITPTNSASLAVIATRTPLLNTPTPGLILPTHTAITASIIHTVTPTSSVSPIIAATPSPLPNTPVSSLTPTPTATTLSPTPPGDTITPGPKPLANAATLTASPTIVAATATSSAQGTVGIVGDETSNQTGPGPITDTLTDILTSTTTASPTGPITPTNIAQDITPSSPGEQAELPAESETTGTTTPTPATLDITATYEASPNTASDTLGPQVTAMPEPDDFLPTTGQPPTAKAWFFVLAFILLLLSAGVMATEKNPRV
jgi:hypothetical protein